MAPNGVFFVFRGRVCYNSPMKNFLKKNLALVLVIFVILVAFVGLIIYKNKAVSAGDEEDPLAYSADLSGLDLASVLPASDLNGGIADHIKGDANAPLTIFEYADYQCTACASMNPYISQLLEEYKGKLKIVYRSTPLTSIHPNAIAAASAVEAAGLQGYWEEYGNLLFSNQAEWFYSKGTTRTNLFMSYFTSIAGDSGNLAKFRSDMSSEAVKKKVKFDNAISEFYNLNSTPSFIDEDGKEIEWVYKESQTMTDTMNFFREYIDNKLKEKGID